MRTPYTSYAETIASSSNTNYTTTIAPNYSPTQTLNPASPTASTPPASTSTPTPTAAAAYTSDYVSGEQYRYVFTNLVGTSIQSMTSFPLTDLPIPQMVLLSL